jgi:hypothetical protein
LHGASELAFLTDDVAEARVGFELHGRSYSINNQFGEWWFFVNDPLCPDEYLREVPHWSEQLLGSSGTG